MARHDALIAGFLALDFFARRTTKDLAMNVFVAQGPGGQALEKYLQEEEGYVLNKIRNYTRVEEALSVETKIEVAVAKGAPVQWILKWFYTTAAFNIITWNRTYSLFPVSTFVHNKVYLLSKLDGSCSEILRAYQRGGWDVLGRPLCEEKHREIWNYHNILNQPCRRIGDRLTWTIPLDTTGVKKSSTPDTVLQWSLFEIQKEGWQPYGRFILHYPESLQISAPLFKALVLKHQYTPPKGGFRDFLGVRLGKLSRVQLSVLQKKDQPQSLITIVGGRRQPLATCTCTIVAKISSETRFRNIYDNKIPQWFDAYRAEVEGKGTKDDDDNKDDVYW